jgi:hypothetical protein
MSGSNLSKFPNQAPGVPIIGQPLTIRMIKCPVDATFTCNCVPGGTELSIVASQPVTCPLCQKQFAMAFNPTTNGLEIAIGTPSKELVPA